MQNNISPMKEGEILKKNQKDLRKKAGFMYVVSFLLKQNELKGKASKSKSRSDVLTVEEK